MCTLERKVFSFLGILGYMYVLRNAFRSAFFGVVLMAPVFAQAAALYIDPANSTLYRGDAITLAVRLDVDEEAGECINAVDATIEYPANIDPVDVSVGKSIFSVWVEEPTINRDSRTITFAGGVPNGYCGRVQGDPMLTNTLVELVFRSPGFVVGAADTEDANRAVVVATDATRAYLNDGRGTAVVPERYSAIINLERGTGPELQDPWNDAVDADTIPPEEFSIQLYQQDISGKWIITYSTTDKQTGIDQYQVMEEPIDNLGSFQWGRADAPWIEPDHPNTFMLRDQSLNSVIRVRAIDKAGNERIATLIPDESLRGTNVTAVAQNSIFVAGIVLLGAILVVVIMVVRQYFKRRARSEDGRDEDVSQVDEEGWTEADEEDDNEDEQSEEEYEDEEEEDWEDDKPTKS